jgi:glyceraldehyde 3-phosphate dehydrogenase
MKTVAIGINGLGRIGRNFLKQAFKRQEIEIKAVNDLGDIENLAYLLRHDSVYGASGLAISIEHGTEQALIINGKRIVVFSEKDPAKIPWGKFGADIVVESTGVFESYEKARAHILGGAKRVIITAPAKDEPPADLKGATVLMGINDQLLSELSVTSNASCTTNAGSPVMAILHEKIGIEKALLNTVHSYTATQAIVDGPAKGDYRRGRAGAFNIVPSSTGAAIATTKVIPDLQNKFDGISIRVPVIAGSIVDITFVTKRDTSVSEVNDVLRKAADEDRWRETFAVTDEALVSSDILGAKYASIADLNFTRVVGGNLVKVLAWYDNEMGYSHTLVLHAIASGQSL